MCRVLKNEIEICVVEKDERKIVVLKNDLGTKESKILLLQKLMHAGSGSPRL